jgi:hypothetical protein
MSLIVKFRQSPFIAAPAGTHIARCCRVIELGLQMSPLYQTYLPRLLLAWELPYQLLSDGKPFLVTTTYHCRLTERTKLMQLLESWRGQAFTKTECEHLEKEGFDLSRLLGKPCMLTLQYRQDPRYPQPWAHITDVKPLPEGTTCPDAINPLLYYALNEHSEGAFAALPERIRHKIKRENTVVGSSPQINENPTTTQEVPLF